MEFTKQEIDILKRITSSSKCDQWMWEAVYLVPSTALIIFGALEESKRSIFVGAGVLVLSRIITIFQQHKAFDVLRGLCNKIYARNASE